MKKYLCYILLQILCICLLPIKGQSTNAEVVVCNKPNTPSYTSSFAYQAFSPIDIQAKAINGSYTNDYHYDKQYRLINPTATAVLPIRSKRVTLRQAEWVVSR